MHTFRPTLAGFALHLRKRCFEMVSVERPKAPAIRLTPNPLACKCLMSSSSTGVTWEKLALHAASAPESGRNTLLIACWPYPSCFMRAATVPAKSVWDMLWAWSSTLKWFRAWSRCVLREEKACNKAQDNTSIIVLLSWVSFIHFAADTCLGEHGGHRSQCAHSDWRPREKSCAITQREAAPSWSASKQLQ